MADEPVPPAAGDESSGTSTSEVIQDEPSLSDESYSTESVVGAWFENLTDDQVAYLNSVKDALGENSAVFSSLYHMVHDLERERTGALKFRKRARALFEEHPEHIMGLNNFLPKGYKITAASPTESVFEGGLDFLKQVEKRYKHDNQRYIDFCSILEEFRNNTINWIQASGQLGQLISDSSDLLKELCLSFLSDFST